MQFKLLINNPVILLMSTAKYNFNKINDLNKFD